MEHFTSLVLPHGPLFAIEEQAAQSLWAMLSRINVQVHRAERVAELREKVEASRNDAALRASRPYDIADGVATFDLVGPMTKMPSSLGGGTSTAELRRAIDQAADDPQVKGVLLRVDSPGGSVAGTDDLAQAVAACAKRKPVYAYIEDLGASAAYWVSANATRVYANRTALVGSLGVYSTVVDMSKAAELAGIKVHVLSTGKYKGAGSPGAPISEEQLEQFRENVLDLNGNFMDAVARGRSLPAEKVEKLFDGAVHAASKAKRLGLVDAIASEAKVFADLHGAIRAGFDSPEESTLSGEDLPLAGKTLAEDTEALLAGARGVADHAKAVGDRLADLKADRAEADRDLGPKALGHIDDICRELAATTERLQALRPAVRPDRSDLERAILRASIALAS